MNSDDMNTQNLGGEIPQRAVSIFGQNEGMDDFPVLKAFQQYIDAEQEKARKRIIGLGIFFGAILVIVITVFMILLHGINTRNQTLSDRLVEYAMKEADRRQAPAAAQSPAQDTAALKAMTEALVSIQQKLQNAEAKPVSVDAEHERKVRADTEKLERAKKLLEQEKQRLDAEKERLRQIEIDRQRRKLYPELYEDDEGMSYRRLSPSRSKSRNLTDEDIREIIREAYSDAGEVKCETAKSKKAEPAEDSEEVGDLDGAIEYFKDDDYTIPVDVKGSSSKVKFTVPMD